MGVWNWAAAGVSRSEEHTSELQSRQYFVCRLLLEQIIATRSRSSPEPSPMPSVRVKRFLWLVAVMRSSCLTIAEVAVWLFRSVILSFFFNDTATTEIYTLSLHDALPISPRPAPIGRARKWSSLRSNAPT